MAMPFSALQPFSGTVIHLPSSRETGLLSLLVHVALAPSTPLGPFPSVNAVPCSGPEGGVV